VIDFSLLISGVLALGAFGIAVRVARPRALDRRGLLDVALGGAVIGVLVARVAALLLEDPRGLLAPRDVLLIRGGVEFWPGVVAAAGGFLFLTRGDTAPAATRLADVAPAAVAAYAAYEGACVVRGGCFGPTAALGLRPPGLSTPMVPVGIAAAAALFGLAVVVRRMVAHRAAVAVVAAIGGVAAVRGVAGFGLPHIGDGLTRPHVSSLAVAVGAAAAAIVLGRTPTPSSSSPAFSTTTASPIVDRAEGSE